jgi:hypothetical protein
VWRDGRRWLGNDGAKEERAEGFGRKVGVQEKNGEGCTKEAERGNGGGGGGMR